MQDEQHQRRHADVFEDDRAAERGLRVDDGVENGRGEQDVQHDGIHALVELRPRDVQLRAEIPHEHQQHEHGHLGQYS